MKKRYILLTIFLLVSSIFNYSCNAEDNSTENELIREPVVAGKFYPSSEDKLKDMIDNFLKRAPGNNGKREILGLIVPHAGYIYSGQVAACGYKSIKNKDYETVILIGPSHRVPFNGVSVWKKGYWETPLGRLEVDSELAEKLIEYNHNIKFFKTAHKKEHSIEVQLPFLQMVLDDFKILPIVTGTTGKPDSLLSEALLNSVGDKKILVIASTDMSHYLPYSRAVSVDRKTMEAMVYMNTDSLLKRKKAARESGISCVLCGFDAVTSTIRALKGAGADELRIINYANSGDVTGKKDQVVGYCSALITREIKKETGSTDLNKQQKEILINIARQTLRTWIRKGKIPEFNVNDKILNSERGAFVTLRNKETHKLRGCIGHLVGDIPLWKTIRRMTVSATRDKRFMSNPITPEELDEINIEISVLSPLKKINSPEEIVLGRHGVIVRKDDKMGVFLPQVAYETGWGKKEFLTRLCTEKAGLAGDAWKSPEVELYVFTAQVFSEIDF